MKNITPQTAAAALGHLSLPDVISVDRLADHLQLSPSTVRDYLRRGTLPGRKIGQRWFVTRRELLAFVETSRVPAHPFPSAIEEGQ